MKIPAISGESLEILSSQSTEDLPFVEISQNSEFDLVSSSNSCRKQTDFLKMSKKKLLLPYRSRITTDASKTPNQQKTEQNVIIFSNFSSSVCQKRNRQIQSKTENGSKRDYFLIVSIVRAITEAENTITQISMPIWNKKKRRNFFFYYYY